jgi:nitrogen fixation protein NifT
MKVMLRMNAAGNLSAYVAKKDLEEEVVKKVVGEDGSIICTLTNGWELSFPNLTEPLDLPKTVEAKRL